MEKRKEEIKQRLRKIETLLFWYDTPMCENIDEVRHLQQERNDLLEELRKYE